MNRFNFIVSLLFAFFLISVANGQVSPTLPEHVSGRVSAAKVEAMHRFAVEKNSNSTARTTTTISNWYNMWDQNYVVGISELFYFDFYQDSNLIDNAPPASSTPYSYFYWLGMGMSFDATDSSYSVNAAVYPVSSPMPDTGQAYSIDSVAFYYKYIRNNVSAVGDSLIVEISRSEIGGVLPDSGAYALRLDTVGAYASYSFYTVPRFASLRYDAVNNDCLDASLMNEPVAAQRFAIPLTTATLADTLPDGDNYFIQALGASGLKILPGTYGVIYIYFKSGVNYPLGTMATSANFLRLYAGEPKGATVFFPQNAYNPVTGYPGSFDDGLMANNLLKYYDTTGFSCIEPVGHEILIPSYGSSTTMVGRVSGYDVPYIMFHVTYDSISGAPAGITNNTKINNPIEIYPNPTSEKINVTNTETGDYIILYDMTGRILQTFTAIDQGNNTFSLNGLCSGLYLVNVLSNTKLPKAMIMVEKL